MKTTLRNILIISICGSVAVGCSKKEEPKEKSTAVSPPAPGMAGELRARGGKSVLNPFAAAAKESNSASPTAESDAAPASGDTGAAAVAGVDHGVWELYWPEFKKAALAKDMKALRALTAVGEEDDQIDEGTFADLGDMFLSNEVIETLAKTDAASISVNHEGDDDSIEIREFSWSETAMVDGEEMGSGLFFYFKKIDGKYRLFRLLAAG